MHVDWDGLVRRGTERLDRDRLRHSAGTTIQRGVRWSRGAVLRARTGLPGRGQIRGLLSIVVPAYNVEAYIDECLASLRAQSYRHVEILVVDDGSPDRSAAIARSHARRDPRVRVVTRPNGGLSAARNTGVEAARGEFLTFVDSDDVVAPRAYERTITALRSSGSDFAVTHYDRLVGSERRPAARWIGVAHRVERLACTLDDFPAIQVNAVAWSKVYRRSFYDAAGLRFPTKVLYEDQPVSAAAFAAARTFDVLPFVCVSWRVRGDNSSISQQSWTAPNLRAQIEASETSLEILERAGRHAAAEQRAIQLMANNLPQVTKHALGTDDEYWGLLRTSTGDLRRRIQTPAYVASIGAEHKVLNELILQDRRTQAQDFIAVHGLDVKRFRTTRTDGGVRCELPVTAGAVPEEYLLLADSQLDLVHRVTRAEWVGDRLTVSGWAYIRNLDLAEHPPHVELGLAGPEGRSVPFHVETSREPRLDDIAPHWYCDYTPGGFTATLPLAEIPEGDASWSVELAFEASGLRRTTRLYNLLGTAVAGPLTVLPEPGRAVTIDRDSDGRLRLIASTQEVGATSSGLSYDGSVVRVDFRAPGATALVLAPSHDVDITAATGTVTSSGPGSWHGEVALPALPRAAQGRLARPISFSVLVADGSSKRRPLLAAPGDSAECSPSTGRVAHVTLGADQAGCLRVSQREVHAEVTSVTLADAAVEVTLRTVGLRIGKLVASLASPVRSVVGTVRAEETGRATLRFELTGPRWGVDDLVLPQGRYHLQLESVDLDSALRPLLSPELLRRFPVDELQSRARVRLEAGPGRTPSLGVAMLPPLKEDERGVRNQRILREEARVDHADLDAVFLRSLYGEVANCNPLALHEELFRRGSGLQLLWSVQDRSVAVPRGGVALIEGSREWHRALARSRFQMVNVHQLSGFVKPEGQKIIQTMHGYPFKVMGHEWWQKGSFAPSQVASYDSRARDWDFFVSPATYATPLLEAAFLTPAGASPKILEIGYPRNDVLLSAEAPRIRRRVRDLLGIRPEQTVVLYAPTFRDYLSPDDMKADIVDFFDVQAAARRLGPGFVFLMRGHAFNVRANQRYDEGDSVVDVTDYPDVNDLCLASDVAVLDYSSLRFDYGLTDKPMIFFTPDLEQYDAARGGILDYASTAPGPLVRRSREVVDQLRRLDSIDAQYRDARRKFRETYLDLEDGHATDRLIEAVFTPGDVRSSGEDRTGA
jgi:CDP-glycerol glycerophosphotransferase